MSTNYGASVDGGSSTASSGPRREWVDHTGGVPGHAQDAAIAPPVMATCSSRPRSQPLARTRHFVDTAALDPAAPPFVDEVGPALPDPADLRCRRPSHPLPTRLDAAPAGSHIRGAGEGGDHSEAGGPPGVDLCPRRRGWSRDYRRGHKPIRLKESVSWEDRCWLL